MNTDQITPVVRRWLRHTEATPPDARQSARQVMARMPHVRQRSRWLPLPTIGRRTSAAPSTSDREGWLEAPPDTTYRFPTATGRTRLMFSPVKAIIAGALVFAIGGVMLVAQPFDQQGSVPGIEQAAEPAAPVKVTATFQRLDCDSSSGSSEGSFEEEGPVEWVYGSYCTAYNRWSDPRLQGTETYLSNGVEYMDDSELYVAHYVHDIVTDDGAWRMRPQFTFDSADGPGNYSGTWVLDGEGAHEGFSVVLAKDELNSVPLIGYIISTDVVPSAPEGASTQ